MSDRRLGADPAFGIVELPRRQRWSWACAVVVLVGIVAWPSLTSAQVDDRDDPAVAELAERHAPIVRVREQDHVCDTGGEPFEPAPVEIVLDNAEVFLRQVGNDDPVAMRGPSAADLHDLREGWYLDFPGDALEPGCIFEQDYRRFAAARPSAVYAHVATQADRPGMLALQYWLFWYHNPAKNDHEGDWEFIQLLFDVGTAEEALDTQPVAIGYAQHTGGERADWDDAKLEREGARPVVYPAVGSHASYFGQALYLGRSGSEGFGCDNTDGPSRRLDPEVVVLPDEVTDPADPMAWLAFQGRWGQRERGFFNGPTGPYAKMRWDEPVRWHDDLRESSVVIPGGDHSGDAVLTSFCDVVEVGSSIVSRAARSPATGLVMVALVGFAVIALVGRTRWSPVSPRPLRHRRAIGQILATAGRAWREHPTWFLVIGTVSVPVAFATSIVQWLVLAIPFVGDLVGLVGDRSGPALVLALLVGGFGNALAFAIISALTAAVIDERSAPHAQSREVLGRLLATFARAAIIVVALFVSIVGIPWGVRQLVRYQVVPQVVVLEERGGADALRRCAELTVRRWWWTFATVAVVQCVLGVVAFTVPLVLLVLVPALPLWTFGLLGSVVYVVLAPLIAAATTYLYGDLVAASGVASSHNVVRPARR